MVEVFSITSDCVLFLEGVSSASGFVTEVKPFSCHHKNVIRFLEHLHVSSTCNQIKSFIIDYSPITASPAVV